jgi:energy-coupling factor transporter ATP-binding protein EcfA2
LRGLNLLEGNTNNQHDPIIDIRNLTFRYYGSQREALSDINLKVEPGEIVLLAGHSGCGKSTLLRTINGLIPHQHAGDYYGEVLIEGAPVAKSTMSDLALKVGYIFQNPENQIFMFSVERDIAFGPENLALPTPEIRRRVDRAMDLMNIRTLALRAPHELSDGQKQRVALAGTLAMYPRILILDEPTSLLDPFTARLLVAVIEEIRSKLGMTILIVEHRLDLVAKVCDRMVVMDRGKIALSGTPKEVLSKADVSLFGVTEPTIVKLSKLLSITGEKLPIDPQELSDALRPKLENHLFKAGET